MKKPMIKALAMTMAITMALSTPLTASAAGLADLYRTGTAEDAETDKNENYGDNYGDGDNKPGDGDDNYGDDNYGDDNYGDNYKDITGEDINKDVAAKVIGLALSETNITIDKKEEAELIASVMLEVTDINGEAAKIAVNAVNMSEYSDITVLDAAGNLTPLETAIKSISWRINKVKKNDKYIEIVKGSTDVSKPGVLTIEGIAGGSTSIVAYVKGTQYTKTANVKVVSYADSLRFKETKKSLYVKHTTNLYDVLEMLSGNEPANDKVTWDVTAVKNSNKKAVNAATYAVVDENGNLTAKKVTTGVTLSVVAISEHGYRTKDPLEVIIEAGVSATKVTITSNPLDSKNKVIKKVDLGEDNNIVTYKATATGKGGAASTDFVKWSWPANNVVEVVDISNGAEGSAEIKIIPKHVGSVKLTATATSGKKATITLKVTAAVLQSVDGIAPTEIFVGQGVKAVTTPADYTGKFTYEFADPTAVGDLKINKKTGVISLPARKTFTEATKVKVKAIPTDRKYKDFGADKNKTLEGIEVTVKPSKVGYIEINNLATLKNKTINVGKIGGYQFKARLYTDKPTKGGQKLNEDEGFITWSTSNAKIATIDSNGLLTPIKAGSVKVIATTYNAAGKAIKSTLPLKVKVPAEKITITNPKVTVNPKTNRKGDPLDQNVTLKSTFPKGTTKETVTWNPISVDSTKFAIKGKNNKANLTVTVKGAAQVGDSAVYEVVAENGARARATITVCKAVTSIKFNKTNMDAVLTGVNLTKNDTTATATIKEGAALRLEDIVTVDPAEQYGELVYTISGNKSNISLDKKGVVYGFKATEGKKTVTVTIKAPTGKAKATLKLTVVKDTPAQ